MPLRSSIGSYSMMASTIVDSLQQTTCTGQRFYSITSSARPSSVIWKVRLSVFAVLRLITSSIFTACITGRSAGLAPLRIFAESTASAADGRAQFKGASAQRLASKNRAHKLARLVSALTGPLCRTFSAREALRRRCLEPIAMTAARAGQDARQTSIVGCPSV